MFFSSAFQVKNKMGKEKKNQLVRKVTELIPKPEGKEASLGY